MNVTKHPSSMSSILVVTVPGEHLVDDFRLRPSNRSQASQSSAGTMRNREQVQNGGVHPPEIYSSYGRSPIHCLQKLRVFPHGYPEFGRVMVQKLKDRITPHANFFQKDTEEKVKFNTKRKIWRARSSWEVYMYVCVYVCVCFFARVSGRM